MCIEKRPYTLYGRLATLHFRYLTCLLDRGHINICGNGFFTTYSVLLITSLTFQLLLVTHYSLLKVHHSSLKAHHSVPSMLLSVINIFFILFSSFILIICIYRKSPLVNLLTNGLLLFFHYYIVLIFYSLSFPLHQEYASYHMHLSYALELLLLQN